jgi:hypothetical protein
MRVDDAACNIYLSLPDVTEIKREDEEIGHSVAHHAQHLNVEGGREEEQ